MNIIAAKAVAFGEALRPEFKRYAKQVLKNAKVLEKEMTRRGYKVLFGGTENHMIMVDVFASCGVPGKIAEHTLDKVGITVNKNMTPDDPRPPFDPSGIRIGVPAITTRGMREKEVKALAGIIDEAIRHHGDTKILKRLHLVVKKMCKQFPLYK